MPRFNERGEIINDSNPRSIPPTNVPPSGIGASRQNTNPLRYLLIGLGTITILICMGAIMGGSALGWLVSSFQPEISVSSPNSTQSFSSSNNNAQPTEVEGASQVLMSTPTKHPTLLPSSTPRPIILTATDIPRRYAQISSEVEEVNLRRSPGYITKTDSDVIVKIPQGSKVQIISGPEYADDLAWWYISWNGYEGWVADHTGSGRTILIFDP